MHMKKSIVSIIEINENYQRALKDTFDLFPDVVAKIKSSRRFYISTYIDYYYPQLYQSPLLLERTVEYIRQNNPSAAIFVLCNNIYGNFSRLLAHATPLKKVIRKYKAKFIYLDEKKPDLIQMGSGSDVYQLALPRILSQSFSSDRKHHFFLNLAQLKVHPVTKVAGGLFNHLRLIAKPSQHVIYSDRIHQVIADVSHYIEPDFTILDANTILTHGMLLPADLIENYTIRVNRLLAGSDGVAVDSMASRLLSYRPSEIKHILFSKARGIGTDDHQKIDVQGEEIHLPQKAPCTIELNKLPKNLDIIIGENKEGVDACLGLTLEYAQLMYHDFDGLGNFSLIMGNEFTSQQLENLVEPIIVAGVKACQETAPLFKNRYHSVYYVETCEDVVTILAVLMKIMNVNKYNFIGSNPIRIWIHLLTGRLNGLKYHLPSISRRIRKWKSSKTR